MAGHSNELYSYKKILIFDKGQQVRSIEFQKFIDLVTFDQSLVKIERDIKKMQEIEQSFLVDMKRLNEDFVDVKSAKDQARKAVDEKELYMNILNSKELELKNKLDVVANQKEYQSLQKELSLLHEKRMQHEQDLLALWNRFDLLDKNYESKHKAHEDVVAQLNNEIQTTKKEISELTIQLDEQLAQRELKKQPVPQEWLDMYVNMKGRVSNPVVPVVADSCDACFYSVTPRDLQHLRQNKLLQCRDCYRLLYLE